MSAEKTTPTEKIKISVSAVKADLKAGLDRKEIGAKYGLRPFEVQQLFKSDKLKGLRTRPKPNFDLIDDEPVEGTAEEKAPVAKEAATTEATQSEAAGEKKLW